MVNNNLYFTIIRENGFIKPFILSFSVIEEVIVNDTYDNFSYYKLSIKGLRKLKLLNLSDILIKEKIITLQKLLNDTKYIKKYDDIPKPTYKFYNYGFGLYGYYITTTIKTIEKKPKINTKNISYKNRFIGKVNKKVDFHKSNYKRK